MWKGLRLLIGLISSIASTVTGERLAVEMYNKYRTVPIEPNLVLPLPMHANPTNVTSHVCSNAVLLIAGGEQARYGEFPQHALLGYLNNDSADGYEFKCGGALISDRHVLTAAHCFATEYPSVVRLGVYDVSKDDGLEVAIEGFLRHPDHRFTKANNDIALVKLEQRVYFTTNIRPACLWDMESSNSTEYTATGFCNNDMYGVPCTQLIKVVLEEFPQDDCAQRYKFTSRFSVGVTDGQLCIGSNMEGRLACLGDPGSSLLTLTQPKNCMYHVVGITPVRPYGCGVGKSRALYTKVSHYLNWIQENVWGFKANLKETYESLKFF